MKILTIVARVLLGVAFLFFGLNGLFLFLKPQAMPAGPGGEFLTILMNSHYAQVVSVIEVVSAVLFLINRFVPLALTLLGPVLFNILLYHLLLMPKGIVPGAVLTLLWFVVFYAHRAAFAGIFAARA